MTIKSVIVTLAEGTTTTQPVVSLTNAIILWVARAGLEYDESNASPGNREYKYISGAGALEFLNPGTNDGSTSSTYPGEAIYVLYKY